MPKHQSFSGFQGLFTHAALSSGSDKYAYHGYHRFYPHQLERFFNNTGNFLEIGVNEGRSIGLWKTCFPRAFIHGADIDIEHAGDRFCIHRCDQSDRRSLGLLAAEIGTAFAVVDDGSHVPEHQLTSFDVLFSELLIPGGIYIFEDMEVSYWRRGEIYGYPAGYGREDSRSCINVLKSLVDWLNRKFLSEADRYCVEQHLLSRGLSRKTCDAVASMEFAENCVILRKREHWEIEYEKRPHLHPHYV